MILKGLGESFTASIGLMVVRARSLKICSQTHTKDPDRKKDPTLAWRQILSMSSDDSKPYMIGKALDEIFQNHIGFAIIRARRKELSHGKDGLFCEAVLSAKLRPVQVDVAQRMREKERNLRSAHSTPVWRPSDTARQGCHSVERH